VISTAPPPSSAASTEPDDRPIGRRVLETVQTVLLALALAFIFRAFFVEPFIIPTGSMAESLLGVHATRLCPACGWEFNVGTEAGRRAAGRFVPPPEIVCANCRLRLVPSPADTFGKAGDRVLVHKWAYALGGLLGPDRWDVIVFRDPGDPDLHYIKRLVGLPGETVEILDGDVFIDGRIARKPPAVQAALWTVVFDQSHVPVRAAASGGTARWVPEPPAAWNSPADRILRVTADAEPASLRFNAEAARDYLLDFSSYNGRSTGALVGDVRLVLEITRWSGDGTVELELVHPPDRYAARLSAGGIEVTREPLGEDRFESSPQPPATEPVATLARASAPALRAGWPVAVEFGYLDQRLYLRVDGRDVVPESAGDCARTADAVRAAHDVRSVRLGLRAERVRLAIRGLRIDRDVYYTITPQTVRAYPGRPFQLGPEEYFVLGDNSADSFDSREWAEVGPHLPRGARPGSVRADQIVGRAAFVYLPGLLATDHGQYRVPDVGRMRFVR